MSWPVSSVGSNIPSNADFPCCPHWEVIWNFTTLDVDNLVDCAKQFELLHTRISCILTIQWEYYYLSLVAKMYYGTIIFCVLLKTSNIHLFWQHPWTWFCSSTLVKTWILAWFSPKFCTALIYSKCCFLLFSVWVQDSDLLLFSYSSLRNMSLMLYKC